ncbi:TonB-dependent receptor [Deefgea tanakiae]|uniref:TonB-dependent receptor n=1 Tax=Deefgea tanakiae TaxID=2865840 RepID=A0ABX8ZC49_9NEIS|nr:TonB-dependent receptor [Deefgea tanakiae]QZA78735.1 TonB-dependent receptor [Deefgea tanakiae]
MTSRPTFIHFTLRPIPLLLGALLVAPATTYADDIAVLNPVVVTAAGFEQQIREAPASISVITGEELRTRPFNNLADAVRNIEGISVTGYTPNDKDIQIRGLPGEYTLILVDGKRQNTRETTNRGSGGVQASLIPPLAAIERVEVIRGPMSSLYGADAMGGVINIITRKVGKEWQGTVGVNGTLQEDSAYGNTAAGDFWLSGPLKEGLLGLQIFGNYSDRAEDSIYYPSNGTTGAFGTKNTNVGIKLTLTPTENQDFILEAGRNELTYDSTVGKTSTKALGNLENVNSRDNISLTHNGRWGWGLTSMALYQEKGTETNTKNGVDERAPREITNTTFDGFVTLPFDRHVLKFGTQLIRNELSGLANEFPVAGHAVSPNDASAKSWALFLEDEYALTNQLSLTGGLRMDDSDLYGSHWSPRLYAVYKLNDFWTVRGGAATGFKAPTLRQTTAGYCMTTGRANTGLRPGSLCGNPNLKPEESTTQELGVRYDGSQGESFSLTIFNNDFENKVVSYDTGKKDPRNKNYNIYVYDNLDEAVIRGAELAGNWPINRQWAVSGNYTYTYSSREGGKEPAYNGSSLDGQPLSRTPKHMLNAHVDWTPTEKWSNYLHAKYSGEEVFAGFRNGAMNTRTRPGSLTFDLGARYTVNKQLSVSLAVLNLTDKIVDVDTRTREKGLDGNWMVDEGRRYWMKVDTNF